MTTTVRCLLVCLAGLSIAWQDPSYVRDADGWLRLENGREYRVSSEVVTVQFEAPVDDVAVAVAGLADRDPSLAGLSVLRSNRLGIHDLSLPAGADPLEVVGALRATGLFALAEETATGHYTGGPPNDADFGLQWNMHNTGQSGGAADADVDALEAWAIQDGDPSVAIAVLDSGTDWTHPDLADAIWTNIGEIAGNGTDDDNNGYVDDIRGWDFDGNDNNPTGSFTHGTWVAGVVGARGGNGIGIAGLAGGASDGQGCMVMALNVGSFSPNSSVLDDAILYAVDNGARVITMSLTVPSSGAIDQAITAAKQADVFVNCSAGNFGGVTYPSTNADVMAVGGTNDDDNPGGFSSGPQVEVAAPGVDVYMTELGGGYGYSSGTSFSSPHVAALAGLILSENPALSAPQVRQIIIDTADDVSTPGFDNATGNGRINAAEALMAVSGVIPGAVISYGAGLAGTGGVVPQIAVRNEIVPTVGSSDFVVALNDALPGAVAWFLAGFGPGSLPFAGGTVLVDLGPSTFIQPLITSPAGIAGVLFVVTDDPVLAGLHVYCQWVVEDPGAVEGFAFTSAFDVVIGT
jgi:subtilisin family serine protease